MTKFNQELRSLIKAMSWELPQEMTMMNYKDSLREEIRKAMPLVDEFESLEGMMSYAERIESELFLSVSKENASLLDLSATNQDQAMGNFYAYLDAKAADRGDVNQRRSGSTISGADSKLSEENASLRKEIEELKSQVLAMKSPPADLHALSTKRDSGKQLKSESADLLALIEDRIEQGISRIGQFPYTDRGFHPGSRNFTQCGGFRYGYCGRSGGQFGGHGRRGGRFGGRGGRRFCGFCQKTNHFEDECRQKQRYMAEQGQTRRVSYNQQQYGQQHS